MLIDSTYFSGPLLIDTDSSGSGAVLVRLNEFIQRFEPKLLKKLFGVKMYRDFMTGLGSTPIESKWLNLLTGNEDFPGIVQGLQSYNPGSIMVQDVTIQVGRGEEFDPIEGASVTIIPPQLVGKRFVFEQKGAIIDQEDYTVNGNVLSLTGGYIFSGGDRYYFKPSELSLIQSESSVKKSFIANYVYFYWMQDNATQSLSVGESMTRSENADRVSPEAKQRYAWNEMVEQLRELRAYLNDNYNFFYPDYGDSFLFSMREFEPIYIYGL